MKKIILISAIIISCIYGAWLGYENLTEATSAANKMEQLPAKPANAILNQHHEKSNLNNQALKVLNRSQNVPKELNNKFAYILNSNSTTISKCEINQAAGQFEDCVKVGRGFNAPTGITVSKNHLWMYVTNRGDNNVSICQVESQFGELENCHSANSEEFNRPTGITLDEVNAVAYITNVGNNTVSRCDINPLNMELANCIQYNNRYFNYPSDIKLGLNSSDLFVVNAGSNSIAKCRFDTENSDFNCNKVLDQLSEPQAVFFTKNYIYIPNLASKLITVCSSKLRDNQVIDCRTYALTTDMIL